MLDALLVVSDARSTDLDLERAKSLRGRAGRLGGGLFRVARRERAVGAKPRLGAAEEGEERGLRAPRERVEQRRFERAERARSPKHASGAFRRVTPGLELEADERRPRELERAFRVGARLAVHGRKGRRLAEAERAV